MRSLTHEAWRNDNARQSAGHLEGKQQLIEVHDEKPQRASSIQIGKSVDVCARKSPSNKNDTKHNARKGREIVQVLQNGQKVGLFDKKRVEGVAKGVHQQLVNVKEMFPFHHSHLSVVWTSCQEGL
jgi:hypothetical protein